VEPQTGGGVLNMEELIATGGKPVSRPPMTDRALRLAMHEDNRQTAMIVEPAVRMLPGLGGRERELHHAVRMVIDDPAAPGRWETERVQEAGDHADTSLKTYHSALRWIAEYAATWYPGVTLAVAYDPEDEPAASRTEAHQHRRRHTAEDAYRDLAALVEKRLASGISITDAVQKVAHNNNVSQRKVWRAREFVRGELSETG
jgi:hypothetical protein